MEDTKLDKNKTSNSQNVRIPKNVRQIGSVNDLSKVIYAEDYVMSYMKQLSQKVQNEFKIAIFLGKYVYNEEGKNIFIKGAIEMDEIDINENRVFTDESWTKAYVTIKEYFTDVEIVGWAIIGLGMVTDLNDIIINLHTENFSGPDKVLLKYDYMEKEEIFYISQNNQLIKQDGYYIYYEKNEEMQNYMIDQNQEEEKTEEEYEDVATKKIKNVIDEKETKKSDKKVKRLTYAVGTVLAVIVLVTASTMLRNYYQMRNLETALTSLTQNLETSSEEQTSSNTTVVEPTQIPDDTDTVDVDTVSGDVEESSPPKPRVTERPSSEPAETTSPEPSQTPEPEETEPETEPVTETPSPEPTQAPVNEVKYYIVRQGDSLASISKDLYKGVNQDKINEIIKLNEIKDQNKIFVGQQLIVP